MSKYKIILIAGCVLGLALVLAGRVVMQATLRTDSTQSSAKAITEPTNQPDTASVYSQLTNWLPFIPLTEETPTCAKAHQCVRDLGTNAIPVLIALLREQDPNLLRPGGLTRSQGLATFGFATLGAVGAPAVSSLVSCMDDERPGVRAVAATCLCEIGQPARNAAPRLVAALSDPSEEVRLCAVHALTTIPVDAELVVPGLVRFLQGWHPEGDNGDWGQIAAIAALEHYDAAHTAQAIPILRRMTNATNSIIQSKARGLLATIENPPKPVPQPETVHDEQVRKFNQR